MLHALHVLPAPAELSHWIDGAVIIRLGSAPGISRFPALPHAMLTMRLVRPARHTEAGAALCAPVTFHTLSTDPVTHSHGPDITALGLLVRPEAAACLLGATTGAVVNQVLPWATLAGAFEAERLDDEIHRASHDITRVHALMHSFGRTMATVSRQRDQAYARLCAAVGCDGALAGDTLGLGRRQLERRCQAVLGLAPKSFQRLVRFHRALGLAMASGSPGPSAPTSLSGRSSLTAVALDTGFYDQSHLARDARRLAGAPIGTLIAQARPDTAWWPLAARTRAARGLSGTGHFSAAGGAAAGASPDRPAAQTTGR
jgi:AraC-like DNA-binding protein